VKQIHHLVGTEHGRVVKKIFGKNKNGRPGLRWLEDAEKDKWEMKVKKL